MNSHVEELKMNFPKISSVAISNIIVLKEVLDEYNQGLLSVDDALEKVHFCKRRTFFRKNSRYLVGGIKALVHKNSNLKRKPLLTNSEKIEILDLYSGKKAKELEDKTLDFSKYTFSYFHNHLLKRNITSASLSTVVALLKSESYISPKARTVEMGKAKIAASRNIEFDIGERVEIDATEFYWEIDGEMRKMYIHVAYDRGLKAPLAIFVANQETTVAYFELMARVNRAFGIPLNIYTDKRGCFVTLCNQDGSLTKFGECFTKLGSNIESSSNSNFKPGVENYNKTLKSHLNLDLEREGIHTMEGIQSFLEQHVFDEVQIARSKAKRSKKYYKKQNVFIKKVNKYVVKNKFIINEDTRKINNDVLRIDGTEYCVLFNEKLRKLPKSTTLHITTNYLGEVKYKVKNEIVTLIKSEKAKVQSKQIIKKKPRVMPANNTISVEGVQYVPVYNSGELVRINHKEAVHVFQPSKNEHNVLKYKNNTYRLKLVSEVEYKEFLKADKLYKVSYRHTLTISGKIYLIIDSNGNHLDLTPGTSAFITTKNLKYEAIIEGESFDLIELKRYHKKTELPTKSGFKI